MKPIIYLVAVLITLVSCEKVLFEPDLASGDPYANFDHLWREIDRKYSYFELKQLDWSAVRNEYRSRLNADMNEEELFDVLADMMNTLRDDHSNLIAPFNLSRYNLPLQHPKNFHARTIQEHYLPEGRFTGAFFHDFLAEGDIGYVRYSSFMSTVGGASMAHIINRYRNTRGLVLDLRENGGGNIGNVTALMQYFIEAPTLVGTFITRNGPDHNDFGPPQNFSVAPSESIRYTGQVAVLIDRGSYSATTMFAVATKAFDHIILVGDTTGGGGGLPNGGQLPNGWMHRFSVSQLLDLAGNSYAEDGVPPEVTAFFDWTDLTRDEVLERAIDELLN